MISNTGARPPDSGIIVFDLGGTWFRSAILMSNDKLVSVTRRRAINYRDYPTLSAQSLQDRLVDYIVDETRRMINELPHQRQPRVGISLGAAVNAHTGQVLNSGPLWGPSSTSFDLTSALRAKDSAVAWTIINDVTAALLYHSTDDGNKTLPRFALVTISTGIACRTYDTATNAVPVDRIQGLQGEIGHLPTVFAWRGEIIDLHCDCGGTNHLNAFCSGRGIEALIRFLAASHVGDPTTPAWLREAFGEPERFTFGAFAAAVLGGDSLAAELLDSVTEPVARSLLNLLTLDPQVERVILTGGVVDTLRQSYLDSLLKHLEHQGLYQRSDDNPRFFRDSVVAAAPDAHAGLRGAGLAAGRLRSVNPGATLSGGPAHALSGRVLRRRTRGGENQWSIHSELAARYSVKESEGLLELDSSALLDEGTSGGATRASPRLLLLDANIAKLYGARVAEYCRHHQVSGRVVPLPADEKDKTLDAVLLCLRAMEDFEVPRRHEPVIAIGGGVLLDIVGTAAGLYRRGIPYVRVPTTLLSLVDAGVGIKVGVNHSGRKNRIGSFYPPEGVLLDRSFLRSQDARHISSGLAEILKIAIMRDRELFMQIEGHGAALVANRLQGDESRPILQHAVDGMLEELAPNLWEHTLERRLDFGHSFSPTIEMETLPSVLHGEAVAIDMAISIALATHRKLLDYSEAYRAIKVMRELGLPISHGICTPDLLERALADTTVHRGGAQHLPLPTAIGACEFVNDVTPHDLRRAISILHGFGLEGA